MHVHVMTPRQRLYGSVMQGQKARSWRFKIGTSQLRETTLTENIGPPRIPGGWAWGWRPHPGKNFVTKSEETKSFWERPGPTYDCRVNDDDDDDEYLKAGHDFFHIPTPNLVVIRYCTICEDDTAVPK
jgi:hypothetical protein